MACPIGGSHGPLARGCRAAEFFVHLSRTQHAQVHQLTAPEPGAATIQGAIEPTNYKSPSVVKMARPIRCVARAAGAWLPGGKIF